MLLTLGAREQGIAGLDIREASNLIHPLRRERDIELDEILCAHAGGGPYRGDRPLKCSGGGCALAVSQTTSWST